MAGIPKPQFRDGQFKVRYSVTVDGVTTRPWFPLGTDIESVANAKNRELAKRIAAGDIPRAEETKALETFRQAADRVLDQAERDGMRSVGDRRQRLRDYAMAKLGHLKVDAVRAAHIREVLEATRDAGKSKQTVIHLRNDIRSVFVSLWRDEIVKENPVDKVGIPKGLVVDDRPRQILTDDEFARFAMCVDVPFQLRVMALVSRTLGGMRTSDLHAWDWSHIDTRDWTTARIKRPKVRGLTFVELPPVLVDVLQEWWEQHGKPTAGPVFPANAGQPMRRRGGSTGRTGYARQLRKWLRRALGIDVPVEVDGTRGDGQRWASRRWVQSRELTARELDLLESQDISKRVDFHSFRRAFVSAVGDAGVNAQSAMRLTGHTQIETHMRYVDRLRPVAAPAAAMPALSRVRDTSRRNPARHEGFEPSTFGSGGKRRSEVNPYGIAGFRYFSAARSAQLRHTFSPFKRSPGHFAGTVVKISAVPSFLVRWA